MAKPKRRIITVQVTLSVAAGITKPQAVRELRTRVNEESGWYQHIDTSDVRVRKAR